MHLCRSDGGSLIELEELQQECLEAEEIEELTSEGNVNGEELVVGEVLDGVRDAALAQQAGDLAVQRRDAHIARAGQPGALGRLHEAPGHPQIRPGLVYHHQQVRLRTQWQSSGIRRRLHNVHRCIVLTSMVPVLTSMAPESVGRTSVGGYCAINRPRVADCLQLQYSRTRCHDEFHVGLQPLSPALKLACLNFHAQ